MTTLIFLLALGILLLGPKKAFELSRMAGTWWRKIEEAKNQIAAQIQDELNVSSEQDASTINRGRPSDSPPQRASRCSFP